LNKNSSEDSEMKEEKEEFLRKLDECNKELVESTI
jgi:hypothetical protein